MFLGPLHNCHLIGIMLALNTAGSGSPHTHSPASTSWMQRSRRNESKVSFQLSSSGDHFVRAVLIFCFTCVEYWCELISSHRDVSKALHWQDLFRVHGCLLTATVNFSFHVLYTRRRRCHGVNHLAFLCVYVFPLNQIDLFIFFVEPPLQESTK